MAVWAPYYPGVLQYGTDEGLVGINDSLWNLTKLILRYNRNDRSIEGEDVGLRSKVADFIEKVVRKSEKATYPHVHGQIFDLSFILDHSMSAFREHNLRNVHNFFNRSVVYQ